MRRKRERREEEIEGGKEIGMESKKIAKSPIKEGEKKEGEIRELMDMMVKMRMDMEEGRKEGKKRAEMQEKWWRDEMSGLKEEMRRRDERWEGEIVKIRVEMKEKEKRMEEEGRRKEMFEKKIIERLERLESVEKERKNGSEGGVEMETRKKLEIIERKWEMMEREKIRKNIIIRGLKGNEIERTEEAMKVLGEIGIKEEIEGVNIVKGGRGMARVTMESIDSKKKVMQEKRRLAERKERIESEMTWKEREMMRKIEKIAAKERIRGSRVWIRYGRIEIDGKWWKWDEEKEVLRDGLEVERESEVATGQSGEGKSGEGRGEG